MLEQLGYLGTIFQVGLDGLHYMLLHQKKLMVDGISNNDLVGDIFELLVTKMKKIGFRLEK